MKLTRQGITVELVSCPPDAVKLIERCTEVMTGKSYTLEEIMATPHQTSLELVYLVFKISGITRATSHQIVRTRLASYIQQSQRVTSFIDFVKRDLFASPPDLTEEQAGVVAQGVKNLEKAYNRLLALGCPLEDARALLPTNIKTALIQALNFRSLLNLAHQRLCEQTQKEHRTVVTLMKECVAGAVSKELAGYLVPSCEHLGYCDGFGEGCGRYAKRSS